VLERAVALFVRQVPLRGSVPPEAKLEAQLAD
jgi:hypothetical protein